MTPWQEFVTVARGGRAGRIPVAFIVDSPWLPGYAGIDMLDYFVDPDRWLKINLGLLDRFPDVAWIPGFWVEYGMAAEPSALGARVVWHHENPPSIQPLHGGLDALVDMEPPNPQEHGLMPLVLQRYLDADRRLAAEGIPIRMVTSRGPLAIASWLLGVTDLLIDLKVEPEKCRRMLDLLTTMVISWLKAQIEVLRAPEGILLLDDIVGMVSPKMFDQFVQPYYRKILDQFDGMVKVLHNDTPCLHLAERLAGLGIDVFNFSQESDIAAVQAKMPNVALMGNVPPLALMVRGTPAEIEAWARESIHKTGGRGLILSAGGGISPGTPAESLDAVVRAARSAD